ncbi:protein sax-3-like [Paramacrobiotus metropolitanus]|uniref:protein sax-3-like n=1 Tax=Paramacrobiotus metropolitanus TaxID=2943436 RepID=UPI002446469E|nr:protein sax-3-like [Paramacrobiotus metropolitanus]XP_055334827.1 protein sax-3-like [Paramacrobiotus metropolitanus]
MLSRRQQTLDCGWMVFLVIILPLYVVTHTSAATHRPSFGSIGGRAPKIIEHPADVIVRKNEPAVLQCKADGLPVPQISWYKDHGELISSSASIPLSAVSTFLNHNPDQELELPRITQHSNGGALHFSRVIHNKKGKSDSGVYFCLARNKFGEARSNNASLQVAFLRDEFRRSPNSSVRVAAADNALLECQPPRGIPKPKITWKRDGVELKLTGRFVLMDDGNLLITGTKLSDTGSYTCLAENVAGSRESPPSALVVFSRPVITLPPQDVTALAELNVVFDCQATGDPKPTIAWRKTDGRSVTQDTRFAVEEDGGLRIEHVSPSDEGAYVCQADNLHGSATATAHLTIHTRPTFLFAPRDQIVSVNSMVSMECVTTGNPPPAVFWSKEGSQILMFPGQPHGRYVVHTDGTLLIEKASMDDTGYYICSALSVAGSALARGHVQIIPAVSAPPPIIVTGPSNQTLAVNSIAILPCHAMGPPVPSVHWLKDGVLLLLANNPRIQLLDSGTLQLSDLRITDSGIYTCIASSESGETMWSAGLVVEDPTNPQVMFHRMPDTDLPAAPSQPFVLNVTETSIEISWRSGNNAADLTHSGSPALVYRIEYFCFDQPSSWIIVTQSALTNHYVITGLKPDASYIFLVRAVNQYGISPPSKVSELVRTEGTAHPVLDYELAEVKERLGHDVVKIDAIKPVSATAVNIHWTILRDEKYIAGYLITYHDVSSPQHNMTSIRISKGSAPHYTLFNLKKFTTYEISLTPFYKDIMGKVSNSVTTMTLQDVPDEPPQNIRVQLVNLTALQIHWTPPVASLNGKLAGYRIFVIPTGASTTSVHGGNSSFVISQVRNISVDQSDATTQVIGNLTTGMRYRITLAARTDAGLGVLSKPLYIRMEPNIADTAHLLQQPWFLAVLGVVILLLLITLFFMFILRRKEKDGYYKTSEYSSSHAPSLPFHPCAHLITTEHGTLLPNSIVGLGTGPGCANCGNVTSAHHNPCSENSSWLRSDNEWTKCKLHQGMFMANAADSAVYKETNSLLRTGKRTCPIHGHTVDLGHAERRPSMDNNGVEKLERDDNRLVSGSSGSGTETGNHSTSSKAQSYPETVSVHSQRSTPQSQRSNKRNNSAAHLPVIPVNWADLLPPPPQHPPPDQSQTSCLFTNDCDDNDDNFTALDYKCNKHKYRGDVFRTTPCEHNHNLRSDYPFDETGDLLNRTRQRPASALRSPVQARKVPPIQASLDRALVYAPQRLGHRDTRTASVFRQFMPHSLSKTRSFESSIANEDTELGNGSSENDPNDVDFIDDGVHSETSPCLSSEASFFLDTEVFRRSQPGTELSRPVREPPRRGNDAEPHSRVSNTYRTGAVAVTGNGTRPPKPVSRARGVLQHQVDAGWQQPLSVHRQGPPKKPKRTTRGYRSAANSSCPRPEFSVMTLPVERAERRALRDLKVKVHADERPKKISAVQLAANETKIVDMTSQNNHKMLPLNM